MAKIAIIGDVHFGVKGGSIHFAEYQIKFFNELLFPYMLKNNITEIFQLGDLFDHRSTLNLKMFHTVKLGVFDNLVKHNFKMHTLIGNHDSTLKESLTINTTDSLLGKYIDSGHVITYTTPQTIKKDKLIIDIIPWMCGDNEGEIKKFISRSSVGDILLGHLEVQGGMMQRGIPGHGGLSVDTFERYASILSGHYHTRSFLDSNRIQYIGTPTELNFGDCEDTRGITILDTETMGYDFIPNPYTMFIKLHYNDGCDIDLSSVSGKYVKLYVHTKDDKNKFDKYLGKLKDANPHDLAIIENMESVSGVKIDETLEIEDTHKIMSNYIDNLETKLDKNKIKKYISELYLESVNA
jgi:DNA repair exonuclease SbcCD nuclease subunit